MNNRLWRQNDMIKEIKKHKIIYFLLSIILLGAAFVRVYRTEIILQFYFDMGRDAIQIWEFLHKGDFFLIGPTTGIAGIFRGPYYYYLIAPFYWLGNGNPVWPAQFLALTTIAAIILGYYLGYKFKDRTTGVFFAILAGYSFHLMRSARWLSNPTPMMLLSVLYVFSFFMIMNGNKIYWVLLSFVSGLSLFHFGSSGELFYFLAIVIFILWQYRQLPSKKIIIYSFFAFLLTIAPLALFDFRNDHLLTRNIQVFLFEKQSFKTDFWIVFQERIDFYNGVFWGKVFPSGGKWATYLKFSTAVLFIYYFRNLIKNKYFNLLLIILLSPIAGLFFFQGNESNIYDYYMTGYYFIWMLFLALVLRQIWTTFIGKIFVLFFLGIFLNQNLPIIKSNITDGVDGPTTIAFEPQIQIMDWIYADAAGENFNTDVYVPPVIPHAYNYLFLLYGENMNYEGKVDELVPLLYTIYEEDPPHPERLEAWLARQAGIGEVVYEEKFAGITVQRRKRIQ